MNHNRLRCTSHCQIGHRTLSRGRVGQQAFLLCPEALLCTKTWNSQKPNKGPFLLPTRTKVKQEEVLKEKLRKKIHKRKIAREKKNKPRVKLIMIGESAIFFSSTNKCIKKIPDTCGVYWIMKELSSCPGTTLMVTLLLKREVNFGIQFCFVPNASQLIFKINIQFRSGSRNISVGIKYHEVDIGLYRNWCAYHSWARHFAS